MGIGHWRTVARTASEISAVPDLPPPPSAVGTRAQAGADLAGPSQGVRGPRETSTGGGFYRRLLRAAKKGPRDRTYQAGKGTKIIALAEHGSLPLAVSIESASPDESQLVEGVLGHSFPDTLPARLIGDKAYDSDRLDSDLAERYGIEMIAPHRGVRRSPT